MGVNDNPIAENNAETLNADQVLSDNMITDVDSVDGADSDPEGDMLVVTSINGTTLIDGSTITLPSGALLTVNDDGSYDYDPNGAFDGLGFGQNDTDSFTYDISDGNGGADTAVVLSLIHI